MLEEQIKEALEKAYQQCETQSILAEKIGISQGLLASYLSGSRPINNMTLGTWAKLEPVIRQYLPPETRPVVAEERAAYNAGNLPTPSSLDDSLLTELLEVWSKLTKSDRLRTLAIAHDFLEGPPKHVELPAGEPQRRKREIAG